MTLSNKISAYPFPFKLNANNVKLPDFFATNLDTKISFEKTINSLNYFYSSCSLSLCKEDYNIFLDFVYNKTQKSKLKFYMDLEIYGKINNVVCDITSNINVSYRTNIYEISFDIAIYSKNNF